MTSKKCSLVLNAKTNYVKSSKFLLIIPGSCSLIPNHIWGWTLVASRPRLAPKKNCHVIYNLWGIIGIFVPAAATRTVKMRIWLTLTFVKAFPRILVTLVGTVGLAVARILHRNTFAASALELPLRALFDAHCKSKTWKMFVIESTERKSFRHAKTLTVNWTNVIVWPCQSGVLTLNER